MHIEDRSKPVGDSAGKQVNLNVNSKDITITSLGIIQVLLLLNLSYYLPAERLYKKVLNLIKVGNKGSGVKPTTEVWLADV